MNVLVIDVGTSSMRGILFDHEGRFMALEQETYHPEYKSPVWVEQKADDFCHALVKIVSRIAGQATYQRLDIDVISITAQRSAVIPLDGDGTPLMPAIMWQDTRNAAFCQELERENDTVFELSGTTVNTVFSGGKMAWIKQKCPEISGKVRRFVTIPEYLIYHMTGHFVSDQTYGSRSNLMNLRTGDWDDRLLKIFGISREELPFLVKPGSVVGTVISKFARATGVKTGILVISAGGDQQCAAVGQGVVSRGNMSVVTGTGAYLAVSCDHVPEDLSKEIICNCSAVAGEYILEANLLTCASAFEWYLKNFYDTPIDYDRINQELKTVYNTAGEVIVLPYFQGKCSGGWNTSAKALFANITLSATRQDMLKSLVEGIFLELRNGIELFRNYVDISQIYISGGMTNSSIMNQMQADIYQMPLTYMKNSEATAMGALLVTLVAQKVYHSVEEAFQMLCGQNESIIYWPDSSKASQYQEKSDEMKQIYKKIYEEAGV